MASSATAAPAAERPQAPERASTPRRPAVQPGPHDGYRHEAFLWKGEDEFLAGTVPFILDGLAAGQPVMVAVIQQRIDLLRAALGPDAAAAVHLRGHGAGRPQPGAHHPRLARLPRRARRRRPPGARHR